MNLPLGYQYSSVYAGIRKTNQDDLALIVSNTPASAAAVFTVNRVQAAPVTLAKKNIKKSRGVARAILVNAGNANCATHTGDDVARDTTRAVAAALGCPAEQVIPASTGVIGVELDGALITNAIPRLTGGLSESRFDDVARAIMTTDTVAKTAHRDVAVGGAGVRISGLTKGSGMIQPQLATTLGFVVTDARIEPKQLQSLLVEAATYSYNRISVDGDTSTNDIVVLLANGASAIAPDENGLALFREQLGLLMQDLAKQIVRDGEGARKLISIQIQGAKSDDAAARMARAIANSPLVKTAIAGSDPNWGRILSAAGNSGVDFDPSKVTIELQRTIVCRDGVAAEFDETDLKTKLDDRDVLIRFLIGGRGKGTAAFWTCDLTEKYIEINASYRT